MPRRWKWDFEDEHAVPPPPPPPEPALSTPSPVLSPPARRGLASAQVRRRRGGAVLIVLALVALLVVALGGSNHSAPRSGASSGSAASGSAAQRGSAPAPANPQAQVNAVHHVLSYTPFVRLGGGRSKEIALTFDDGPGPYTPEVLGVLEHLHVNATFFVIGKMLRYFGNSTLREIRDGDVIGDHTETHPQLALLSAHEQHEQLFEQIVRIELLDGPRPTLFRPPYGSYNATTMRELHRLHLLMVLWSADTEDYQQPGVPVIVERALAGARPGAIILMHDGGGTRTQTIAALPTIITRLRARGYRLVTVPELLRDDPPAAGEPLPPNLSGD